MKKLILLILTTIAGTHFARCELGETRQQSANRYGPPFQTTNNVNYYKQHGYVVAEWFDQEGLAEVIAYYKLQGTIDQAEGARFYQANLPAEIQKDDWIEQTSNDANTRCWITINYQWYFESGSSTLGRNSKYLYSSLVFATLKGFKLMMQELQSGNANVSHSDL